MGEQRVLRREKASGMLRGDETLGVTIGHIRRVLSCAFVRSQSLCLLARIGQLGPGARPAAARRVAAQRGEEVRRLEALANWQATVRGRGLSRVGMVFTS